VRATTLGSVSAAIPLLCVVSLAQTPVRDRAAVEASAGISHIRGRVVAADTGTPLRRAQVRALGVTINRLTSTDAEGRYEFQNLPAGRYTISVNKAGYVGLDFGQRRPFEGGRPLDIADAQIVEGIDFALPRGSVIAGRITDDAGDPIVGAYVHAMRYQYAPDGRRRLLPVESPSFLSNLTNDLGEFRLFGLMPGTYLVGAQPQNSRVVSLTSNTSQTGGISSIDTRDGFLQTYFPGTPNVAEAQPVLVNLSEEAQASFSLATGRMSKISGIARRSDGRAAAGMSVDLRPSDAGGEGASGWGTSTVAADGSFSFANVPPGQYVLEFQPRQQSIDVNTGTVMRQGSDANETREFARIPISLNGTDVTDLSIATRPGITVSGRVVMEQAKPRSAPSIRVRIGAASADSDGQTRGFEFPPVFTVAGDKGLFQLRDVMGVILFRPIAASPLVLNAVTLNDEDITDKPYDWVNGDLAGVEIHIAEQAQLNGTAKNASGDTVRDFRVALFPAKARPSMLTRRFVHTGSADPNGRFHLTGLPSGDYLGVAVESFENGEEWDPVFQRRVLPAARRFSLSAGQTLTVELPFVK